MATSALVGIDIAASALRFRGKTTPTVGSLAMRPSATAARKTPHTIVNRVSILVGASRAVVFLSHASTCERWIDRSCMSPNVTPAVARSAFSRVDAGQTWRDAQSA